MPKDTWSEFAEAYIGLLEQGTRCPSKGYGSYNGYNGYLGGKPYIAYRLQLPTTVILGSRSNEVTD